MSDIDLIRRFVEQGDAAAFAQIVRRHIDWVYSLSLRLTRGNHALADDVTQAVFVLLSRKAASIRKETVLATWLFATAKYCHRSARRHESRLQNREKQVASFRSEVVTNDDVVAWDEIVQFLDETVGRLGRSDRQAILMRFYQGKPLAEVGVALGISEEAARKRIGRALQQLRDLFEQHGVAMSVAALGTALTANTTQAAPATLVTTTAALPISQPAPAMQIARHVLTAKRRMAILLPIATVVVAGTATMIAAPSLFPSKAPPANAAISTPRAPTIMPARRGRTPLAVSRTQVAGGRSPTPTTAPGEPFSMDFRPISTGLPLELVSIRTTFQTLGDGTALKIQLSTGDIISVPFISRGQTVFWWFNPLYGNGGGNTPQAHMLEAWKEELSADGILSGTYWVEGATRPSNFHQFTVSLTAFDQPLPAATRPND